MDVPSDLFLMKKKSHVKGRVEKYVLLLAVFRIIRGISSGGNNTIRKE